MVNLLLFIVRIVFGVVGVTIAWFIFFRFYYFLRDPKRKIPSGNNLVASADGYVLYIKELRDGEVPISIKNGKKIMLNDMLDKERNYDLLIGTFMTPLSVHYNRFPYSGVVKEMIYKNSGLNEPMAMGYLNIIFNLQPLTKGANFIVQNERHITIIENDRVSCAIVQIADKWVNKIENYCQIGDTVEKGSKLGRIKMGSQCDLFLKIKGKYKIKVKEREYVHAGSSVLIELE